MKGKSRAVLTAGLGAVLGLSIAPSAAAVTSLDIGNASLEAKGLVATVPLTFTCESGGYYEGDIYVRQKVQQRTFTDGRTFFGGSCTGEPQTITVQVRAYWKPFKKGTATAQGFLLCHAWTDTGESYECGSARVTEEIQLR